MNVRESLMSGSEVAQTRSAANFDSDGVLLDSPHERAWREALDGFGDKAESTTAMYQSQVAGKPRLRGALATPTGVRRSPCRITGLPAYAECKYKRLDELTDGEVGAAFHLSFIKRFLLQRMGCQASMYRRKNSLPLKWSSSFQGRPAPTPGAALGRGAVCRFKSTRKNSDMPANVPISIADKARLIVVKLPTCVIPTLLHAAD